MEKWPLYWTSDLLAERFKGSLDSVVPSDEDDIERRGSIPFFAGRRGSRLSEIIQAQDRKKKTRRFKDKQGFTWRPFNPDEELPVPRTPQPHIDKGLELLSSSSSVPAATTKPNGDLINNPAVRQGVRLDVAPKKLSREEAIIPSSDHRITPSATTVSKDPETTSLKSNRSDNSFKTASSDPQINFIPRQVSESYKRAPQESAALERKTSVRALQHQQYSALNAVNNNNNNGSVSQKPSRTQNNKSAR